MPARCRNADERAREAGTIRLAICQKESCWYTGARWTVSRTTRFEMIGRPSMTIRLPVQAYGFGWSKYYGKLVIAQVRGKG
jgi:hypothetical protein